MKRDKGFQMLEGCVLLGSVVLIGCHSLKSPISVDNPPVRPAPKTDTPDLSHEALKDVLCRYAIQSFPGAKVLAAALLMLEERVVVKGSCFGYVNAVYAKAGFTSYKRKTVF